jgi:hypothetical protein
MAIDAANAGRGGPLPRCKLVSGDFFESVPPGGDIYVLKRVLFDWTDEEAVRILENCRKAMEREARLLILEPFIDRPNEQSPAHLFDMTFLVMLHGRIRSVDEYAGLLARAGFRIERTIPTESEVSVLEASVGA